MKPKIIIIFLLSALFFSTKTNAQRHFYFYRQADANDALYKNDTGKVYTISTYNLRLVEPKYRFVSCGYNESVRHHLLVTGGAVLIDYSIAPRDERVAVAGREFRRTPPRHVKHRHHIGVSFAVKLQQACDSIRKIDSGFFNSQIAKIKKERLNDSIHYQSEINKLKADFDSRHELTADEKYLLPIIIALAAILVTIFIAFKKSN